MRPPVKTMPPAALSGTAYALGCCSTVNCVRWPQLRQDTKGAGRGAAGTSGGRQLGAAPPSRIGGGGAAAPSPHPSPAAPAVHPQLCEGVVHVRKGGGGAGQEVEGVDGPAGEGEARDREGRRDQRRVGERLGGDGARRQAAGRRRAGGDDGRGGGIDQRILSVNWPCIPARGCDARLGEPWFGNAITSLPQASRKLAPHPGSCTQKI